jgi:hypothetical protein
MIALIMDVFPEPEPPYNIILRLSIAIRLCIMVLVSSSNCSKSSILEGWYLVIKGMLMDGVESRDAEVKFIVK